ncbi:MAG: hypothetical protein J6T04_01945 [Bacteroidales bacterium]|nr:hypothetical protein [Bacteroidales bacterium]
MKRILKSFLFILLLLCCVPSYSQESKHISGKNYEGYSFPKEFKIWGFQPSSNRYTLSNKEINEAEKVLSLNIKKFNQKIIIGGRVVKTKYRLKKYFRQYIGYLDKDYNVIVLIQLWKIDKYMIKEQKDILSKDLINHFGDSRLNPSFEINLTTKELKLSSEIYYFE